MKNALVGAMLAALGGGRGGVFRPHPAGHGRNQEERRAFCDVEPHGYSVNRGTPETTTKGDVEIAKADQCLPSQTCAWWGEPVKVQPIQ